jgi:hypothetical protein
VRVAAPAAQRADERQTVQHLPRQQHAKEKHRAAKRQPRDPTGAVLCGKTRDGDQGIADGAERKGGVLERRVRRKDQHRDRKQRPLPQDGRLRSRRGAQPAPRQERQAGEEREVAENDGRLQPRGRQQHAGAASSRRVGNLEMSEHLADCGLEREVLVPAKAERFPRRRSRHLRPVQHAHVGSIQRVADEQQRDHRDARVDEGAPVRDQEIEKENRRQHLHESGGRDGDRHQPRSLARVRVQRDRQQTQLPGLDALEREDGVERREIQPHDGKPRDHQLRLGRGHERPQRRARQDESDRDTEQLNRVQPVGEFTVAVRTGQQWMHDEEEHGAVLHGVVEVHGLAGPEVLAQRRHLFFEFRDVLLAQGKQHTRLHEVNGGIQEGSDRQRPHEPASVPVQRQPHLPRAGFERGADYTARDRRTRAARKDQPA